MSRAVLREDQHGPALENGALSVAVHLNRGTFSITSSETAARLENAAASVVLHEGPTLTTRGTGLTLEREERIEDVHGAGTAITLRREADETEPEVTLTIAVYDEQPFVTVKCEVEHSGKSPLRVDAFHPLDSARIDLGAPATDWRFYKEGWQDWSPALVLPVSGEDVPMSPPVIAPRTRPEQVEGRFLSELMTVSAAPGGDSLLAGFVTAANQFSQLWLDRETAALTACSYADGIEVPPGGRLASEALFVQPTREPLEAMRRYGAALGAESAATPWPQPVSGWCSWYYYFHGVTEDDVLANLDEISKRVGELPFDYVQVDDGYQSEIGDWLTTNDKFPHGMGWVAERIHEKGLKAGLWLAPFLIGEKSQLWKDHPDWAVQYKPGTPIIAMLNWEQRCYALDLTRPDVIEWLGTVFRTIFDDWGYEYVKIDFIYAGAVDGIRYDPNVTRAQAYRRGIEAVREAAGDRFILGCGQPIGPSVGIVNGARIGPDVAPFWHPQVRSDDRDDMSVVSTLNALRNVLSRWWMHGSLWLNDPDCLMVRNTETALSLDEVRTLAAVIALSGGMVLDSDNLARLTGERREIITASLPVYGKSAVPIDLFTSDGMPRLFELDCAAHRVLAVFNWHDAPTEISVPPPRTATHVFDVWSQSYLGVSNDELNVSLPAHGCALLGLRAAEDRPQVVGSSFHLLQGAIEIAEETWDGETLSLRLRPVAKKEGKLLLAVPDRFQNANTPEAEISRLADNLIAVQLRVGEELEVRVEFG
jgi:alpha-galactosidase